MDKPIIEIVDEDIFDLAQTYLSKVSATTNEFENAIQTKDHPNAFKISHSLKGTSGCYGFDNLYSIAQKLDHFVIEENWDEAKKQVEELKKYCEAVVLQAS